MLRIRVTAAEKSAMETAATEEDQHLSEWVRDRLRLDELAD